MLNKAITKVLVAVAVPKRISFDQGFTLIEILIVIVIIGIISATTIMAVGDAGRGRRVQAAAIQLKNALELAQEQAVLTESVLGIEVQPHGYRFLQFSLNIDKENRKINASWQPIKNSTILSQQTLASYINLHINIKDTPFQAMQDKLMRSTKETKPQAIIMPDSGFTPFVLTVSNHNGKPAYYIAGDNAGNIRLKLK